MQNGYYQATGGMVTQFNKLEVITNNLANINTSGYKRDDVVIADFKRIFKETKDELPIENHTKTRRVLSIRLLIECLKFRKITRILAQAL